jgi:hypothetical protein
MAQFVPQNSNCFHENSQNVNEILHLIQTNFKYTGEENSLLQLDKSYRRSFGQEEFSKLYNKYEFVRAQTYYLVFELARSSNLLIQAIRDEIDANFRFEEGWVLMIEENSSGLYRSLHLFDPIDWSQLEKFPSLDSIENAFMRTAEILGLDIEQLNPTEISIHPED